MGNVLQASLGQAPARQAAQEPAWFTTAPVPAAHAALKRAGWSVADVDLWEVNEAFAVVPMAFAREFGISHDRMNIRMAAARSPSATRSGRAERGSSAR